MYEGSERALGAEVPEALALGAEVPGTCVVPAIPPYFQTKMEIIFKGVMTVSVTYLGMLILYFRLFNSIWH